MGGSLHHRPAAADPLPRSRLAGDATREEGRQRKPTLQSSVRAVARVCRYATAAARLPEVRFAKVDTEAAPRISARHGIRSIPTLVLFHHGQEVARRSGALPAGEIVEWVRRALPPAARAAEPASATESRGT